MCIRHIGRFQGEREGNSSWGAGVQLKVRVKQGGRRACEKLYFKPMTSKWQ